MLERDAVLLSTIIGKKGVWDMQEGATMRMVLLVMRADMIARSAVNQAADIATFKPVRLLLSPSVQ